MISRSDYQRLLLRLYGFHEPIECALEANESLLPRLELGSRRRAHLLIDDLRAVGFDGHLADIPRVVLNFDFETPPQVLGCLYVREGATLGGRVLARRLDHLFGAESQGRSFFSGSDKDPELWRSLCAELEMSEHVAAIDTVIIAARETFAVFERWFEILSYDGSPK